MRVQRDLHTDVLLREGDVTVSLQGSGALFALNRPAQAFLLCASPGSGVITHGYSHPQEADVTCGRSLAFRARRPPLFS